MALAPDRDLPQQCQRLLVEHPDRRSLAAGDIDFAGPTDRGDMVRGRAEAYGTSLAARQVEGDQLVIDLARDVEKPTVIGLIFPLRKSDGSGIIH